MDNGYNHKEEMDYVTNHNFFSMCSACPLREKMESFGCKAQTVRSSAGFKGNASADGEFTSKNAKYIAEDISYMADYEFSATGEILAVRFDPVPAVYDTQYSNQQ